MSTVNDETPKVPTDEELLALQQAAASTMGDVQDTICNYYDQVYSIEETLDQLRDDLPKARAARDVFFDKMQTEADSLIRTMKVHGMSIDLSSIQLQYMTFDNILPRALAQWCMQYVFDLCTDDNGTLDIVTEALECSEYDLFNAFEEIAQNNGIKFEDADDDESTTE